MKINKITYGFVVQKFDTKTGKFTEQEFVAGDQVEYEDMYGDTPSDKFVDKVGELNFDMVQPK